MNKLIATLIVGAFSAAAFAVTPAAPATPAKPAASASAAAKADAVPAVKTEKTEAKHLVKAKHDGKKSEAAAPKSDAAK